MFKFQQQMFAEKKLFQNFAEQFVFHEFHSENGVWRVQNKPETIISVQEM